MRLHSSSTLFLCFSSPISGEEWCHACAVWGKKDGKNVKLIPFTNMNNKKQNTKKKTENEIAASPSFSPSFSPLFSPSFSPSLTPFNMTKERKINYCKNNDSPERKEIIFGEKYILVGKDKRSFVIFGFHKYVYQEKARRAIVKWNRYSKYNTVQYSTVCAHVLFYGH
jgi:hypothetical protein